jgi:hypothetical protein
MYQFLLHHVEFRFLLIDNIQFTPSFFLRVITYKGVVKKNSQPSTVSPESTNINRTSPVMQSTDCNTISSANASLNICRSPTKIVNANIPQPPPSTSQALMSLAVPSYTNERVDSITGSEHDNTKTEQQL